MNPAEYNSILQEVHYSNVMLRGLVVNMPQRRFTGRTTAAPQVHIEAKFSVTDEGAVFVYEAASTFVDTASEKPTLHVSAVFELAVYFDQPLPEEFCEEFLGRQLPVLVRPYLRELLLNLAPRSLILCPPLPTQFVPARVRPLPLPEAKDTFDEEDDQD